MALHPTPVQSHTVRYAGCLASASKLRPKIIPQRATSDDEDDEDDEDDGGDAVDTAPNKGCRRWPWAELMARTFQTDVT